MLSETIAELERLEKAATKGPWFTDKPPLDADGWSTGQVVAAVAPRQCVYASPPGGTFPESDRQFIAAFRTHARALLAAAKLSEKMPKYADTGEAFVPEVDPSWICQLSGHPCKMSPGWHAPDRKWMVAGREQFYSTPEAAANAWQAKTASENNTREKQK